MRVVIASRIFSPEPAAASFRLASLANALTERGDQVTVMTTTSRSGERPATRPNVTIRRFPVLRDRDGYVRGYLQYLSFDIPLFFRLLFERRPDVFVSEPPPTTGVVVRVVSALTRVPYVYYAADVWSDAAESTGAPRFVVRVLRLVEAHVLRHAKRVIAVSDGVARRVDELSGARHSVVVPNGIDTTIFSPGSSSPRSAPTVIYAGTTSEWQGADIFVRAMPEVRKRIPGARLIFLGQGSAWESLEALAEQLAPGAVEFRGVVSPDRAAATLRSARVAAVSLKPGQGYDFAIPTKIFAAVACGTPVLFTGPGPAADIIEGAGLGLAVNYEVATVADALTTMLRDRTWDPGNLAEWAEKNASLATAGRRAAQVVSDAGAGAT
ncbi:glycosyltransferase WbuB [Mycetocola manganoxydans]|uniref:D-inositol 3-phosphate glycosyltransferase n=1 Tax=Mycetocola manganoxydans TaxID=699879 RepID=A0A3L7A0Y8_9MICO|nr:glycosyltransferase family 4 protein [Mycetocola manganoxydans]RLP73879.1 glycosyltransferase WbuB [Mycetocola manganoxydans]